MQRIRDNEDGAVLVFVALILVVIIGFGAIAVDAGALYQEHRELQNGADAAALAIAQSCAQGETLLDCAGGMGDPDVLAEYYADPNAEDDTSQAVVDLSQWSSNTVTVDTTVIDPSQAEEGQLTMSFARVFGVESASTRARARAKWGSPVFGSLGTLPLVISACEYDLATGGSGGGDATSPWTTAVNGTYDWLTFHDGQADECAAQAGQDTDGDGVLAGGFGWIDTNGTCSATLTQIADGPDDGTEPDYEASADTGAAPSQTDCPPTYIEEELLGKVVFIPVFTDLYDTGTKGVYVISFYAAYYISGYHFGGQYNAQYDPVTGTVAAAKFTCPDGGDDRCIAGWFTTATVGSGEIGDGADTGVRVYGLD